VVIDESSANKSTVAEGKVRMLRESDIRGAFLKSRVALAEDGPSRNARINFHEFCEAIAQLASVKWEHKKSYAFVQKV
jgi:hypothetical protein